MKTKAGITCRGKAVAEKVKMARTFLEKFLGLMGRKEEYVDYALVFAWEKEGRMDRSIHMLFMNFPIQVVFLDTRKKVVDVTVLKPWQWNYTPKKKCQYVVEMPMNWGKKVKAGDVWSFQT